MDALITGDELIEVWIIEDHDTYREILELSIDKTEGFVCGEAFSCCEDALKVLSHKKKPDVMLIDIRLGEEHMDGVEGVKKMKEKILSIPFIMVTELNGRDMVFDAICAGASGYLLKSSPRFDVIDAIERVLMGGAIIDAPIAKRVLDMFSRLSIPHADYGLTDREKEVLSFMVKGKTKRQIGEELFLSRHTIDGHIRRIYSKLEVHNKSGAVAKALKQNLL